MMNVPVLRRLAVQCSWQAEQSVFYISCWQEVSGKPTVVDADTAKRMLFGRHRASFYGTSLATEQAGHLPCIVLTPYMALDYFASPMPLASVGLQWDEACLLAMDAAPVMRSALLESRFMPSLQDWSRGVPGWRILHPDPEAEEAFGMLESRAESLTLFCKLRDWFNGAVLELILHDPEVKSAWQPLVQQLHVMSAVYRGAEPATGEEDWLVSVGWKQDETPFRAALQLLEPAVDEHWTLRIMLEDKRDPSVVMEIPADELPNEGTAPPHWRPFVRAGLIKQRQAWARIVPELADENEGDSGSTRLRSRLTEEEALFFLTEGSLRLAETGVAVLLPSWWEAVRRTRPKLKAHVHSVSAPAGEAMFGLEQMVRFDWRVAIGDVELSDAEFLKLAESKRRLFRIHGQWVQLDARLVERIRRKAARTSRRGMTLGEALSAYWIGGDAERSGGEPSADPLERTEEEALEFEIELNDQLQKLAGRLQQIESIPLLPVPEGFAGTLRRYQREGFSWMAFLYRFGMGGCLADDMGLGKTVQWLAYVLYLKQENRLDAPALLICPTSVIGNWQKEAERFAPSLRVKLHYGPNRGKGEAFASSIADADLVITSYTLAHLDEDELSSRTWGTLGLDEAQNIKNAHTKQASSIRRLNARHRIALTGTPLENRLSELWSIFDFLNPHFLGSLRQFQQRFVQPIEKDNNRELIEQVQRLIRPFLLRRMKKDPAVQLDLPDKHEAKVYVSLTQEQGALYESVLQHMMEQIDRLPAMERKGLIVATLTKLKQLCNHPALLLKERLPAVGKSFIERSHKLARLLEMIREVREKGEKCLVFTQYVRMGHLLAAAIQSQTGEMPAFLHGGVPKLQRDRMIERFQNETAEQSGVFILSLRAGGTGLNLTGANHVFHFDRWWNPAVEDQATDRAYRIGQTKDVQVHKLITLGTMEERIDDMIERKQRLSSQIVGGGEQWITELSTKELKDLLALRREWI